MSNQNDLRVPSPTCSSSFAKEVRQPRTRIPAADSGDPFGENGRVHSPVSPERECDRRIFLCKMAELAMGQVEDRRGRQCHNAPLRRGPHYGMQIARVTGNVECVDLSSTVGHLVVASCHSVTDQT